ncbi:hypothetical protein L1887_28648 [Cichorium endivia]|nr:hypothetical protein L1887_28648 [Cichorium endivia]
MSDSIKLLVIVNIRSLACYHLETDWREELKKSRMDGWMHAYKKGGSFDFVKPLKKDLICNVNVLIMEKRLNENKDYIFSFVSMMWAS